MRSGAPVFAGRLPSAARKQWLAFGFLQNQWIGQSKQRTWRYYD